MSEHELFHSIKIGLASPQKIRSWSYGEVKKPETINYRTLKPEKEGLFCEKIFGPTKDWECSCGKYKRVRYKGVVCEKCGVEVTKAKVRRERMGHIELAAPVSHIWYFKGIPSRMGLVLDMSPRALEKVLYFASYVVTYVEPGETTLYEKQLLSEIEYRELKREYGDKFTAKMGAEAIRDLLVKVDLQKENDELTEELQDATGQKKIRITRRLEVIDAFIQSDNKPEWMILDAIPVIPPDLRPMVQLDGGRFATSDLNDLYRRIVNRNNRLKKLMDINAPDIIVRNEKRMLQESVDALIDNGRRGRPVTGPGNRPLKSLSEMLKGKQGRFRQNLLGKRVDYSGRSVIVVGPDLKFYQCGLPKNMALELFKPFVMRELVKRELTYNIKSAKRMVERGRDEVWDVLEDVIKDHPVLLNRAPTLHRLGIQAFEPVLVEGKAIKLHPLSCTAYNADFDGDQMAVHLPLSTEAQAEARLLMLSTNNILALKDGKPITTPTQDMVLGSYYLTLDRKDKLKGDGSVYRNFDEMFHAYESGFLHLQSHVSVRRYADENDKRGQIVPSTVGRFIVNEFIPQDLGFVNRDEDKYSLEIDQVVDKKLLGKIIEKTYKKHGNIRTAELLDNIKATGYHYSTIGAVSISMGDVEIPDTKPELLENAEKEVAKYEKAFRRGLISDEERYEKVIEIWNKATDDLTDDVMDGFDALNNIYIMADSGARGSKNQIRQLAGMRGLMASPSGRTIEVPITSNFREGLSVLEFYMSAHGSRKGLADTALRTADSGYLTRRLVDVSQQVIVSEEDCGTDEYLVARAFKDGKELIESLADRIEGRYSFEDIVNPETGETIVGANEVISDDDAVLIESLGIKEVKVRSVLGCKTKNGVCAHCYGKNLATGSKIGIGEAVGVIAAQSIGEPGTQLTMRTFHTGGVAAAADITQGLPRVEELFEARKPKGLAIIAERGGIVDIKENNKKREVLVTAEDGTVDSYNIVYGSRLKVKQGDEIEAGDELTQGSVYPQDLLRVKGEKGVQEYIVKEVQRVYRLQGVDINDKHIEIIVRQMLSKCKIEDAGDTELLPGSLVNVVDYKEANKEAIDVGKEPAVGKVNLLGITKASLATDSFLSAASFQETTRVLTDAAIKGKEDMLEGLKENIIIGQLIPAGTGARINSRVQIGIDESLKEDYNILENSEVITSDDVKLELETVKEE
ncbi:MAG: DNA-directed RNA polymerase subunit beta' [Peptoniphilus lacydonensis]|uniref:DNA-directed RNA polymerase subunit beta' n=2 Tax=Peptoniphilaceae TaxID=1570339 RepID=UPI002357BD46|nr:MULTISPECIES: DNA-directed RNA polymerase subunit beta' [Peptoniphilus]MDU2115981.1 DNA-directed RNA polymerase subunit beta' [Peptoniphilus lacydonensis]MDU7303040.1 DNA-directed RNA polymerase subunit beta' [Peptoniphilus lacydonensis]